MTDENSRRYLGLWVPFLSADRWRRDLSARDDLVRKAREGDVRQQASQDTTSRPLVFVEKVKGASRLSAADALAQSQGLLPGMALADARARLPMLLAVAHAHAADTAFLARLADAAVAFTPSLAIEAPDGLVLDISGCAHLFAGEAGLVRRLEQALRSLGVSVLRIAVAPTPEMARALARFSRTHPVFANDCRVVRTLPVAALESEAEDIRALRRAGLKTIGDVAERPSVLFASRFTPAFTTHLARVLGEEDRRIVPRRPPPACSFEHRCAEPVASVDVIERIVEALALRCAAQLEARGEGGRLFVTTLFRTDGAVRRIAVETSQGTRDPAVVLRLYRDRLEALADPLDPGFGFDLVRLEVRRTEPCLPRQTSFDADEQHRGGLNELLDRLGAIFGRERVIRLAPMDSHLPEQAQSAISVAETAGTPASWDTPAWVRARPLHLFERPYSIDVEHARSDATPARFRWRRVSHEVARAVGPERIADRWWSVPSGYGTRDYFRVETSQHRRFWIFRADATSSPGTTSRWFLHGVFA